LKHICFLLWILVGCIPYNLNAQIDSGYVSVKNCELFYRVWGEGEPIVFLNGGYGLSSAGYENYAEELSKNHKVILFDQRGTGKSTIKKKAAFHNIQIKQMTKDLEALKKHLGYEKWIVFGHSFGGMYAIYYSFYYPTSISKLIISASPKLGTDMNDALQKFKEPSRESLTKSEVELLMRVNNAEKDSTFSRIKLSQMYTALKARYYVSKPENYKHVSNWFENKTKYKLRVHEPNMKIKKIQKKLGEFDKPVLIMHGLNDFLNISNPLTIEKYYKNTTVKIFADSGHIMSLDVPESYWKAVQNFLSHK